MAEIKKCPKCGGTIHNKIGGKYICSQCGNAISENEVIIVKEPETESTNTSANASSGSSYQSFGNEPSGKKENASKAKKEPRQKVYTPKRPRSAGSGDFDITLWWPIIAAGVAGICFTLILILMFINKFKLLPVWCTLLSLSAYLMTSLLLWPVFDKAGEAPWKALIPIYSSYTLYEISGYHGWYFFLTLIPTVGQVLGCVLGALTAMSLAKKFGKEPTWGIIYLFLLCVVGWIIIAVTNMTYNSSAGHKKDMSPFMFF